MEENVIDTRKASRKRAAKENLQGWGIVGPIILYYAIFGLIPLAIVFRYSFMYVDAFGTEDYVGFSNFVKFFTDYDYYGLLFTTLFIALFTIVLSLVLGMLIALAVTGPIKLKGFYRTVYYIPVVVSMAVVSQIVNVWLTYNNGTINNLLVAFGGEKIDWYDSTFWMLFWIIVICTWKGLGATVILFIAGLNAISPELYEAADVDGANSSTQFFKITIPQLRAMFVFVLITSIIGAFNVFEPVQLISGGRPDGTTKVVLFQIYDEAFQNGNFGMGSAISVVILIILMVLTVLNMKFGEEKD